MAAAVIPTRAPAIAAFTSLPTAVDATIWSTPPAGRAATVDATTTTCATFSCASTVVGSTTRATSNHTSVFSYLGNATLGIERDPIERMHRTR